MAATAGAGSALAPDVLGSPKLKARHTLLTEVDAAPHRSAHRIGWERIAT